MANYFTVPDLHKRFPWYGRMRLEQWRVLRQWVYERDGGLCQYCGRRVELHKCHCHHVLPLSENGSNHPTNLKTLCVDCHKKRHPHMRDIHDRLTT
jgi:5-methylcytosine-specific restriction protein A